MLWWRQQLLSLAEFLPLSWGKQGCAHTFLDTRGGCNWRGTVREHWYSFKKLSVARIFCVSGYCMTFALGDIPHMAEICLNWPRMCLPGVNGAQQSACTVACRCKWCTTDMYVFLWKQPLQSWSFRKHSQHKWNCAGGILLWWVLERSLDLVRKQCQSLMKAPVHMWWAMYYCSTACTTESAISFQTQPESTCSSFDTWHHWGANYAAWDGNSIG